MQFQLLQWDFEETMLGGLKWCYYTIASCPTSVEDVPYTIALVWDWDQSDPTPLHNSLPQLMCTSNGEIYSNQTMLHWIMKPSVGWNGEMRAMAHVMFVSCFCSKLFLLIEMPLTVLKRLNNSISRRWNMSKAYAVSVLHWIPFFWHFCGIPKIIWFWN